MPFMDRDSFIQLLDTLGDPDDSRALDAARTIAARMQTAGVTWDMLLLPPPGTEAPADLAEEDDRQERRSAAGVYDLGDDAALIDRMLAEFTLSDDTRQELVDLKADLAAGEFSEQDSRYIRNLAQRLERVQRRA